MKRTIKQTKIFKRSYSKTKNRNYFRKKTNLMTELNFKKYRRKPSFTRMAIITVGNAKKILEEGFNGKKVSFSEKDIHRIKNDNDNKIAGFIATDGDSYWFVNINYAKKNYFIQRGREYVKTRKPINRIERKNKFKKMSESCR